MNLSLLDLNYKVKQLKSTLDDVNLNNKVLNLKYIETKNKLLTYQDSKFATVDKTEFISIIKGLSLVNNDRKEF